MRTLVTITLIASLTACGTEADRACPTIRATGLSTTPALYAACDPGRAGICGPGLECWSPANGYGSACTPSCAVDRDCAGTVAAGRAAYCYVVAGNSPHCLSGCLVDSDCERGSTCIAYDSDCVAGDPTCRHACAAVFCAP